MCGTRPMPSRDIDTFLSVLFNPQSPIEIFGPGRNAYGGPEALEVTLAIAVSGVSNEHCSPLLLLLLTFSQGQTEGIDKEPPSHTLLVTLESRGLMKLPETVGVATYTGYSHDAGAPLWVSSVSSRPSTRLKFLRSVPWVWDQIHSIIGDTHCDSPMDLIPWWTICRHLDDILVSFRQ